MNPTRRARPGSQLQVLRAAALLAIGGCLLATPVLAQTPTGTILGHVQDASGAMVPGASVTATNLGTQYSRSATTDAEGQYALRLLPVGNYKLEVVLSGFKTFSQTGILIEVGRNARIDAKIEAGGVEEVVSVTADASLVETSSSALSRTVGQNEVLNLPLVNRDLYSLLSITGGVSSNEASNSLGAPEQLTTINGSQRAQVGTVNFQLDGGNNTAGLRGTGNAAPNPEAVQEFRVITNSYAAEYGRYQAGIVDIVTKSGTNQFHGAVYEYFRDESLNAERWAPPGVEATKDPLDRNQFGAAFGGPIQKDKTFFFVSYSGLRQEGTYYRNSAVVPTDLERAGNFSQSAIKPRDPSTGQPFPGGIIPASRFDPAALTIQDRYVPAANLPNNFYEIRTADPYETDEATFKLDHHLSQSHILALSYFYQKGTDMQPLSGGGNIPWVDRDFTWSQHNLNLASTLTLGSTTINQFRATYMRQFGGRINNPTTSLGDLNSSFTIQGVPTLPRLTVNGYFTGQVQIAGPDAGSDYFGFKDTLSLNRGNHAFKFGGEVSYEEIVHDTLLDNYGVFAFNGSKTGNAYADFLLGVPSTMTQDAPVRKTDNGWYLSLFAQDDWRVHPRVTLNLGLRYDLQFPFVDPQDRKLAYVPGEQSQVSPTAPEGLLFPGDPGISRGIVETDYNNIAPRIGVAWDPWGDGKTSVRGAFGTFYGSITGNEWNTTADNQPFALRQPFPQVYTLSDPYRNTPGGNPFPFNYDAASPSFRYPAQVFGPSLDFVWPYTYQVNFTVQRELFRDYSLSASYVGALGRKLPASVDRNYPVYGPGATTANVNARRPYQPGVIGAARVLESGFDSDYHGLQLAAEKRGAHFSAKAYYTFSKALEDTEYQGGGLPAFQNTDKLYLERGRTSNDRTHVFVISGIWQIDYIQEGSSLTKALLNDWTISAIFRMQSGSPLTITSGLDRNLDGLTTDRADIIGEPELDSGRPQDEAIEQWFNTAAFAQPAVGTDGTAGRNIIDGPSFRAVDLGLFRDIRFGGRLMLQFRAEATNLFNTVNLSNPGTSLSAPTTFGKIRTAGDMRRIQLGARLSF
ncbi:MAG TPA: carboxypeptidase regulatory-like domain-containing protein [Vicinamibacteria bacterium]|nr:carboxypeptidase regulatory-like domain-containing protein [Vicinamibacteria bacterium]